MSESTSEAPPLPWDTPGWRADAEAWIRARLAEHGTPATGAVAAVKMRAWSCVLRVPTASGGAYFKAPAPAMAHEVALTEALSRWHQGRLPALLGVDTARGWLLQADGGPRLRDVVAANGDLQQWYRALSEYAEMQIALVPRVPDLLALGVPDRRPSALPALFEQMLASESLLLVGKPGGLSAAEVAQLHALAPCVAAQCAQLASYGLPDSLDHSDFHDGNVLLPGGVPLFFDWGDAGVAHPFMSLTVMLRMIAFHLEMPHERPLDVPQAVRARDVYLEPWTRIAPRARLLEASAHAFQLGMLSRALVWRQVLAGSGANAQGEFADALAAWLREWLGAHSPA